MRFVCGRCRSRHPFGGGLVATFWRTVAGLGDRDTTCAIACALVACRTGEDDVLREWSARVEPLPRL